MSKKSKLDSIIVNVRRLCFKKFCSVSHLFQIMIEITGALQNVWRDSWLQLNLGFPFLVENWLHGKRGKHRISLTLCRRFSLFCLGNNVLLNKNYKDDLDNIIQGHSLRLTFRNFAYVSAILGTILTKFLPQWCIAAANEIVLPSDSENVGQCRSL